MYMEADRTGRATGSGVGSQNFTDTDLQKAKEYLANPTPANSVYIDPNDEALAHKLSVKHGIDIIISKYPFHGGLRAVIPAKNILIDNSFEKKIAEAKDKFDVEMEVL